MPPAKPDTRVLPDTLGALLRSLVAGLLVSVPLVFDPRAGHEGGRPKYLLLVLGAALAATLLGGLLRERWRHWAGNRLTVPVLILLAATVGSAAASAHQRVAIFGFPGLRHGLMTGASLIVLFFAATLISRDGHSRTLLAALWFGAGAGVLLFGLGQLQDRLFSPDHGWNWARPGISPWTIGSTLGNPNHLSSFLAVLLPIGIVLTATSARRNRPLGVVMIAVAIVELAITSSRGATLAAVAGLATLGVLFRRELASHRARGARLAATAVVLAVLVVFVFGQAGVTKVAPESFLRTGPGSTLDLRLEVWSAATRVAADHPVLGAGPDVFPVLFPAYTSERFVRLYGPFTVANGAHNLFFDTLADLGLVGLSALIGVVTAAMVGIHRTWRRLLSGTHDDRDRRLVLGGTTAAVVAYVVQAAFNTEELALSLSFWVLLGVAGGLCDPRRTPPNTASPAGR